MKNEERTKSDQEHLQFSTRRRPNELVEAGILAGALLPRSSGHLNVRRRATSNGRRWPGVASCNEATHSNLAGPAIGSTRPNSATEARHISMTASAVQRSFVSFCRLARSRASVHQRVMVGFRLGQKPPLKQKDIWVIRIHLQNCMQFAIWPLHLRQALLAKIGWDAKGDFLATIVNRSET